MSALDPTGPAPETRSVHFLLLLFGASIAPLCWLGQMIASYAVTAYACYPADHPVRTGFPLGSALIGFDFAALIGAALGGAVSLWCWGHARREVGPAVNFQIGEERVRFLALWGMFSGLCFFCGILFNIIGSLTVPPCLN